MKNVRHWKKRKKTKDMTKSYEREAETEEEEKTKNSPFGQITLEPFACRRNMRSPTPCSSELFVTAVSVLELGVSVRRSCMCRLHAREAFCQPSFGPSIRSASGMHGRTHSVEREALATISVQACGPRTPPHRRNAHSTHGETSWDCWPSHVGGAASQRCRQWWLDPGKARLAESRLRAGGQEGEGRHGVGRQASASGIPAGRKALDGPCNA